MGLMIGQNYPVKAPLQVTGGEPQIINQGGSLFFSVPNSCLNGKKLRKRHPSFTVSPKQSSSYNR